MAKLLKGWAVMIRRADGSKFFACGAHGNVTPVWVRHNRKYALAFAGELKAVNMDARVVPVNYAHPQLVVKGK